MNFEYDSYLRGRCKVICLRGKFMDHQKARDLITELEVDVFHHTPGIMIDLSGLSHMNSVGINSIVKMVHLVNGSGGKLVFINVPEKVRELLDLIRLNSVISICESPEEAAAALAG